MTRVYRRKTDRASSDRLIRVRYERRSDIDAEKVAEVLIRIALRATGEDTDAGRGGAYLRRLLISQR